MDENKELTDEKLKKVSGGVISKDTGVHQKYTVHTQGLTLEGVARELDCTVYLLLQLNSDKITDPTKILPLGTDIIYPC